MNRVAFTLGVGASNCKPPQISGSLNWSFRLVFGQILQRSEIAEGVMRPFFFVLSDPVFG